MHTYTCTHAGNVPVPALECGTAQSQHQRPRALPAVHEAAALRLVPVAAQALPHLPRRQARAIRGELGYP